MSYLRLCILRVILVNIVSHSLKVIGRGGCGGVEAVARWRVFMGVG